MGACCPKLNKSQSYLSMADSDAPLLPGGGTPNGTLGGGRSVPNGTLDSSKDADERAVYTKIIDDTQTQIIDVMAVDQRSGNVSELVDRGTAYQSKLQAMAHEHNKSHSPHRYSPDGGSSGSSGGAGSLPKMALSSDANFQMLPHVNPQEVLMMNEILTQFEEAYIEIKVKHNEPLVTPLEI